MRNQGVDKWPGVRILEGRWQDWLLDPEKMGQVLEGTPDSMGFDAIFVDTFAEGYEGMSESPLFIISRWVTAELTFNRPQSLFRNLVGYTRTPKWSLFILEWPRRYQSVH